MTTKLLKFRVFFISKDEWLFVLSLIYSIVLLISIIILFV